MTIGHEGLPQGLPEEASTFKTILESQAYLSRTLVILGSLAEQSGEPIGAVLAKSVEAYKRQYGEKEGQEALQALAEVEACRRQCIGKSHQEALDVLGNGLKPATYEVLGKAARELVWDRAEAAYAALRADPIAWKQEEEERLVGDAIVLYSLGNG